ncbi:nitroreductase [Lacrimispora amygdalina]|uniref:Nitroreductase n=1 Tax=Lacrimispora amygdalina TaxID=253257 RepID=A0A3E2NC70_9FIRM|nr:nitroreductase family protein [Clostridium indicum]RFZ78481.1 nitroreductase [Clostridium indicum]
MKPVFPVEKTIRERTSVRSYEPRALSTKEKDLFHDFIKTLNNPFSVNVNFRLLESSDAWKGEKLGTYGVIKGARDFIGASAPDTDLALEALGYSLEHLVLYAVALGYGTCWLGGTFDRSAFSHAMDLKKGDLFPVITPLGYPADKKRPMESVMRWAAKSDQRKEWKELFFSENFSSPLSKSDAGDFAYALEMTRLAPSAVNKQPWRVVKCQNAFHFYKAKTLKEGKNSVDLQRVDVGIAACHFGLAAAEKNLPGGFKKLPVPNINTSSELIYLFSWVLNS